jgi:hypothetical protein
LHPFQDARNSFKQGEPLRALGYEVSAPIRQASSLEEAQIRKVEAETAEIEARTDERRVRSVAFIVLLALLLAHQLNVSADLIGHWLPSLLWT